jgi:hypothetical protein
MAKLHHLEHEVAIHGTGAPAVGDPDAGPSSQAAPIDTTIKDPKR